MAEHPEAVRERLAHLRDGRQVLLDVAMQVARAHGGNLYPLDFIMHMVAKRALSTLWGFASLVEQHNMVCARTLLRTQLDSMMRVYAFTLVDNPHELAGKVIAGEHIGRTKDRKGKQMRDGYLVDELAKSIPWFKEVYQITSGFVHLSDEHLRFSTKVTGSRKIGIRVSEADEVDDAVWLETIDCFIEATKYIAAFLQSWALHKDGVGQTS